jgi:IS30 family transposase
MVALVLEERELISRGISAGKSARFIGAQIGRHHSTVSDEICRNGGRDRYLAVTAQQRADAQRSRPKPRKLEGNDRLHDYVAEGLQNRWSPQQIAAKVKEEHPDDEEMRVSHETIYQTLFLQGRGELRTQLKIALRSGRVQRRQRRAPGERDGRGQIVGMINISERPAEADDRAVPGFWEGDLIVGKGNKSQIATLVERTTRYVMLVRVPYDRTAERVALLLAKKAQEMPRLLKKSITWDQGKEMAAHAKFTMATGMQVYFCDPHSPWQRGSNENTNGLLRQYFPKGTDLSVHSQADLDAVAAQLNGRPRQTLGWATPTEKLNELLLNATVGTTT